MVSVVDDVFASLMVWVSVWNEKDASEVMSREMIGVDPGN